jgi:hypothetical protein
MRPPGSGDTTVFNKQCGGPVRATVAGVTKAGQGRSGAAGYATEWRATAEAVHPNPSLGRGKSHGGARQLLHHGGTDVPEVARNGTVAVGQKADLVLLDANPLAEIGNSRRIAGVTVRGRWLSPAAIGKMLREVASKP